MKIIVTHAEAVQAVFNYFNLPSRAEIVISEKIPASKQKDSELTAEQKRKIEERDTIAKLPPCSESEAQVCRNVLRAIPVNKIGAIRDTRTFTGWGLKEAKDFVELWASKSENQNDFIEYGFPRKMSCAPGSNYYTFSY